MSDPPSPSARNPFLAWIRHDDMESLDAALSFPAGSAPLSSRLNDRHPDVDDGETPLGLAVATKNIPLAALLLSHGADPNVSSRGGVPPLIRAGLATSDEGMIMALIKAKADVNRSGSDGKSPLIVAAAAGATNIITLLLAHGGDAARVDPATSYTPLLTAVRTANSSARATELLAAFGLLSTPSAIDHMMVDQHGHTILHHCVINRVYHAIEPLLSHGSNPNYQTKATGRFDHLCSDANGARITSGGRTPLHLANRSNEAKLLLLAGASPSIRDDTGRSSLDYARANAAWTHATAAGSTAANDADTLLQLLLAFGSPSSTGDMASPSSSSSSSSSAAIPPPLSIMTQRSSITTGADTPFSPVAPLFSPAGAPPDTPSTGPTASPASPTTPFHLPTPAHPSLRRPSFADNNTPASTATITASSEASSSSTTDAAPSTTKPVKRSVMFAEPDNEPSNNPSSSSSSAASSTATPADGIALSTTSTTPVTPDFGPVAEHVNRHVRNLTMELGDLGPPGPDDGPNTTRKRKLHVAALGGRLEAVNALIKSGWSVNAATDNASTPLVMACTRGHRAVVEVLLENGADPQLTDEFGSGPLHYACRLPPGHHDVDAIVTMLISHRANVNGPNAFRRTPLHDAVVAGSLSLVDLLIKQGADPNLADTNGSTAIHLACTTEKKNSYEIVSRLIRGGAFVEALDKRNQTPLQVALIGRCSQAAEELVQYGADIRIPAFMDKRSTPLELRNHLLTVAYTSVEQMVRIKLRHELKSVPLDLTLLDQCPKDGAKFGVLRKRHHCGCCGYVYCKNCVGTKRGTRQVCKTCAHVIDHPALYGMQRPPSAFGSPRSYSSRSLIPPATPPSRNSKTPPSPGILPSTPKSRGSSRSISQSSNLSDDVLAPRSADLVIDDDDDDGEPITMLDNGGDEIGPHSEYVPKTPSKVSAQSLFGDDPAFLESLVAAVGELPTGDQLSLLSPARRPSHNDDGTSDDAPSSSSSSSGGAKLTDEQSVAEAIQAARSAASTSSAADRVSRARASSRTLGANQFSSSSSHSSGSSSRAQPVLTRTGTLPRAATGDTLADLFKDDPSFLASLNSAIGDSAIKQ